MDLQENDTVGINVYDGKMTVEKINKPKYLNLQERLEAFYKKPIDEIYIESTREVAGRMSKRFMERSKGTNNQFHVRYCHIINNLKTL
jgi:Ribosomal protein L22